MRKKEITLPFAGVDYCPKLRIGVQDLVSTRLQERKREIGEKKKIEESEKRQR